MAASEMERRVRHCLDVHGRRYGPQWAAYDGKLPSDAADRQMLQTDAQSVADRHVNEERVKAQALAESSQHIERGCYERAGSSTTLSANVRGVDDARLEDCPSPLPERNGHAVTSQIVVDADGAALEEQAARTRV
mgnify:CR=1 FL=1